MRQSRSIGIYDMHSIDGRAGKRDGELRGSGVSQGTKYALSTDSNNAELDDYEVLDLLEMRKVLQGENAKYAITSDIEGKRTIFKTKALEKLRLKNFDFLEMEDMWFLKAQTPLNIAKQGVNYSPVGILKATYDEWEREETYGNIFERTLENTISPGYYSKESYTAVDRELKELYERTGESSVLPVAQQKFYKEKGIIYNMSAKQYTEVKKMRGQLSFEKVRKLIESPRYKRMID